MKIKTYREEAQADGSRADDARSEVIGGQDSTAYALPGSRPFSDRLSMEIGSLGPTLSGPKAKARRRGEPSTSIAQA